MKKLMLGFLALMCLASAADATIYWSPDTKGHCDYDRVPRDGAGNRIDTSV